MKSNKLSMNYYDQLSFSTLFSSTINKSDKHFVTKLNIIENVVISICDHKITNLRIFNSEWNYSQFTCNLIV